MKTRKADGINWRRSVGKKASLFVKLKRLTNHPEEREKKSVKSLGEREVQRFRAGAKDRREGRIRKWKENPLPFREEPLVTGM